jgi:hypothetical protein
MKLTITKTQLSFILVASLVLGSCSSYRQVACPEIDQNTQLARHTSKVRIKNPKQKRARHLSHTANIYSSRKVRTVSKNNTGTLPVTQNELSKIPMVEGLITSGERQDELLIASSDNKTGLASRSLDKTGRANLAGKDRAAAGDGSIELMNKKEQRKFNREFKKEMRAQVRAAAPPGQSSGKPAKPLAIASLVLGITSLLLFPIATGTLAIIFGVIALKRIKANPSLEGRKMALAGLICGIVGVALWVLLVATGVMAGLLAF